MGTPAEIFREEALKVLIEAFGAPEEIMSSVGKTYRWVLPRAGGHPIAVKMNSPEFPHICHLLVSDMTRPVEPIASITMRTVAELRDAIERIRKQWRGESHPP